MKQKDFNDHYVGSLKYCRFEPDIDEIRFLKMGDTLASFESEGLYVYYVIDYENREDFADWVASEFFAEFDLDWIEKKAKDGSTFFEDDKGQIWIEFKRKDEIND